MNYYYPYSTIYLRQHMARLSRGIVVLGLVAISAILVVAGVVGLVNFIAN